MEKIPIQTNEVLAYGRVSSKDQEREGNSLPAQRRLIENYAEDHRLRILHYYEDVETAKQTGRKQFEKMLEFLMGLPEQNRVVLVEKVDRLARNMEDVVALRALNVTLIFVKQGLTINKDAKSSDFLNFNMNVVLSEFYIKNLSEEVKKGLTEKVHDGWYPSFAPIGYRNKHLDSGRNIIELTPESSPYIKKLFELYATGEYSLRSLLPIANSYGLRGIRLKGNLSREGLRRILTNPIYFGAFNWNRKLYPGKHEPIVTKTLFDRVQAILRNGDRPRPVRNNFAYRGLLRCKECGCLITAEKHVKKSGRSFVYYHCTHTKYANDRQPTRCSTGYWTEPKLTELLGRVILRPLSFPIEILNYCREMLHETQQNDEKFNIDRIADLRRKLVGLKKYQDVAYEDRIRGVINEDDWIEKYNRWKNLEIDYRTEIEKLEASNTGCNEQAIKILELTQDIEALYHTLSIDKKAELLKIVSSNSLLDSVTLCPSYKKPFDLLAKGLSPHNWGG